MDSSQFQLQEYLTPCRQITDINEDISVHDNPFEVFDYKSANWKVFHDYLNNKINLNELNTTTITTKAEIDAVIEFLTNTILEAEMHAIPTKVVTQQDFTLSSETLQKIRSRHSLMRNYRRNRNPALKPEINRLSREIKDEIQCKINLRYEHTLEKMNQEDKLHSKLWKLTRNLRKKNSQIPLLTTTTGKAMTDKEKAEALLRKLKMLTCSHTLKTVAERLIKTLKGKYEHFQQHKQKYQIHN